MTLFALFGLSNAAPFLRGYKALCSVNDCGAGKSVFTIQSVSLDPPTPVPGQDMTLTLDYTVPADTIVSGGETEYDITWNYIPFEPSYEPLCQNIPCPLGPGRYKNQSTSVWPDSVSGYIVSQMKWTDEAGRLLLCVEIANQAKSPASVDAVPSDIRNKQLVLYSYDRSWKPSQAVA